MISDGVGSVGVKYHNGMTTKATRIARCASTETDVVSIRVVAVASERWRVIVSNMAASLPRHPQNRIKRPSCARHKFWGRQPRFCNSVGRDTGRHVELSCGGRHDSKPAVNLPRQPQGAPLVVAVHFHVHIHQATGVDHVVRGVQNAAAEDFLLRRVR